MAREALVAALATQISGATGVKSVRRDSSLDLVPAGSLPTVILTDNGIEEINRKTGGLADVYVTLGLDIVVDKAKNQSSALNTVDTAVKARIAANMTLGGLAAHVTILPQTGGDTLGADGTATRSRQVRIFYEATETGGL